MSNNNDLRELTIADLTSVRCAGGITAAADDCPTGSKGKAKAKVRGDEGEEYENCKGEILDVDVAIGGALPAFPGF